MKPIDGEYQNWDQAVTKMIQGKVMCWGQSSFYKMEDADIFFLNGEWERVMEFEHLREHSLWREVE